MARERDVVQCQGQAEGVLGGLNLIRTKVNKSGRVPRGHFPQILGSVHSSTAGLFKVRVPIPFPPPPPGANGRIRTVEELKGACQEGVDEVVLPRKSGE